MKYVYYCERCRATFEVDVDPEKPIPPETACPGCEHPHALRAFAAPIQQSGCCGPAPGANAARGGG